MKTIRNSLILCVVVALSIRANHAIGDTFGSGANTFNIEFVTIGNPGNAPDYTGIPSPAGSVPYNYRIGKFEISEDVINKANAAGGLDITKTTRGSSKPATEVSWFEAAKFVNWLNTSSGSMPVYKFDGGGNFQLWTPADVGYNSANLFRNNLARYFLPSVDEWYKAAYYDPTGGVYFDFPIGSDTPPLAVTSGTAAGTAVYGGFSETPADITQTGGLSRFGTMGQGGNVWEWEESAFDLVNNVVAENRAHRGGSWRGGTEHQINTRRDGNVLDSSELVGFRVASILVLGGDYNGNGIVDAADYTVWRDGLGTIYTQADYEVWKAHFGQTAASGSSVASIESPTGVPEPSTLILAALFTSPFLMRRLRTPRSAADREFLSSCPKSLTATRLPRLIKQEPTAFVPQFETRSFR